MFVSKTPLCRQFHVIHIFLCLFFEFIYSVSVLKKHYIFKQNTTHEKKNPQRDFKNARTE